MTLRAGELRHKVSIRRPTQVRNAKGGFDQTWPVVCEPWAKVEGIDGRESTMEHTLMGISVYRVTIRWRAGILQSDQLRLSDGTETNIRSVADPDGRRERLVIICDTASVQKS